MTLGYVAQPLAGGRRFLGEQGEIGGDFLFGDFCAADAMYAPVATRFRTYAVELKGAAQRYTAMLLDLPAVRAWYADAAAESEVLSQFEDRR